MAEKKMVAISHVAALITNNNFNKEKADKVIKELERLAKAPSTAAQNGTLNNNPNETVLRVPETMTTTSERLDYRDPDASVTRSITRDIEANPVQPIELSPQRKQVPRVDKAMNKTRKPVSARKKQSVLRVTAKKRKSVPRVEKNKKSTPAPIATRTRAKK